MDSALASCAGGPGLIPADGKKQCATFRWVFPSLYMAVGERNGARHVI